MAGRGIGITVTIPEEVLNLLEREAKMIHRSVPEVIRRAIEVAFGEKLRAMAEAKYGSTA